MEQHRLMMFENTVLKKMEGYEMDEGIGDWRKLHKEERHELYSSPNIILVIKRWRARQNRHVTHMGEKRM
jgi:hypothetical protein